MNKKANIVHRLDSETLTPDQRAQVIDRETGKLVNRSEKWLVIETFTGKIRARCVSKANAQNCIWKISDTLTMVAPGATWPRRFWQKNQDGNFWGDLNR